MTSLTTNQLYQTNTTLLGNLGIPFKECTSEPVLSYEAAEKVRGDFGLTGVESKSLFLKGKNGEYYMYVTMEGERADLSKLKDALGIKLSIASQNDLKERTGCEAYCAIPFGFPEDITIVVDSRIYESERFIFSPGPPTKTIEIESKYLHTIIQSLSNHIVEV